MSLNYAFCDTIICKVGRQQMICFGCFWLPTFWLSPGQTLVVPKYMQKKNIYQNILQKKKKMQQALMYCLLCDTIFMREFKGKKQSDTGKCWHVMWTHHRLWSPRFSLPQIPGEKRVKWKREKKRNRIFITSFGWRWVVKQGSSRSSLRCCV